jgi:hypothetical protein
VSAEGPNPGESDRTSLSVSAQLRIPIEHHMTDTNEQLRLEQEGPVTDLTNSKQIVVDYYKTAFAGIPRRRPPTTWSQST